MKCAIPKLQFVFGHIVTEVNEDRVIELNQVESD